MPVIEAQIDLQEHGPSEEDITTLLTLEQRSFEGSLEENSFWHDMMLSSYQGRSYLEVGLPSGTPSYDRAAMHGAATSSCIT